MIELVRRNGHIEDIDGLAVRLAEETGLNRIMCKLLCMRNITDKETAKSFLEPSFSHIHDPFLFHDMEKVVQRIKKAKGSGERVCIYGDYDVDGVCATSILYMYLKYSGFDVFYYIPNRQTEGYGMNVRAIEKVHDMGARLIISVDNGITAHDEIALAYSLGMEVIVTDHHKCAAELPECESILCHTREGETYPNKSLCGAGTAFKIVQAMGGSDAAREFLPFAALATVADVVELTGENRAIVSLALKAVNSGNCPVGMRALADIAQIKGRNITERDFAFGLAPRINAAGRMSDANIAVRLLTSDSYDDAFQLAKKLDEFNLERRDGETLILKEAEEQTEKLDLTQNRILILKSENWNPGIVGISAAKLAEKYYRPVILLSQRDDILVGSARSVPGINIFDIMSRFSDMYIKFGGHSFAAGVTLEACRFKEYVSAVNDYVIKNYDYHAFIPKTVYDIEAELCELDTDLIGMIEKLAPFGEGNPRPVFLTRGVRLSGLKRIGRELNHISAKAVKGSSCIDAVAFDRGRLFDTLNNADACDLIYAPALSEWGGSRRLQLKVGEFCLSEIENPSAYFNSKHVLFEDALARNLLCDSAHADFDINRADTEEEALRALSESFDGTIILCFTKNKAVQFTERLKNSGIKADSAFFAPQITGNLCNTVVYAPEVERLAALAGRVNRVYVLDTMPVFSAYRLCEIFKGKELLFPYRMTPSEEMTKLSDSLNRTGMGKIYTAIKGIIANKPEFTDTLLERVSAITGIRRSACEFAVSVFMDLGLILKDSNDRIYANNQNKRVELQDSQKFAVLKHMLCEKSDFERIKK